MSQSGKTHKVDMKVVSKLHDYPMDNSAYAAPTGEAAGRNTGDANKDLKCVTPAKGNADGQTVTDIRSIFNKS